MVLDAAGVDGVAVEVDAGGDHVGALVHVGEEDGGDDAGLGVEAEAAVAVAAGSDLEVELAVHSVLLRPQIGFVNLPSPHSVSRYFRCI